MISDEVYSELLFDGEHVSPASLPGMAERTATLNSLSKSHAMTGWRVGWVVGPAALCAHLENLALCMLYGSPEFIQDAACTALERAAGVGGDARGLPPPPRPGNRVPGRQPRPASTAPGRRHVRDGRHPSHRTFRPGLADRLLDRHGVSVLAGEAFGPSAAGHIRLGLVLAPNRCAKPVGASRCAPPSCSARPEPLGRERCGWSPRFGNHDERTDRPRPQRTAILHPRAL